MSPPINFLLLRRVMQFSLRHHKDNVTRAAEALGMAKSTFYRKLKELEEKKKA